MLNSWQREQLGAAEAYLDREEKRLGNLHSASLGISPELPDLLAAVRCVIAVLHEEDAKDGSSQP